MPTPMVPSILPVCPTVVSSRVAGKLLLALVLLASTAFHPAPKIAPSTFSAIAVPGVAPPAEVMTRAA